MADAMLHPEFETLGAEAVRADQARLWPAQWRHVRKTSTFYRDKLGADAPEDLPLDAIGGLPFTEKDELRRSQERAYPFGDYLAAGEDRVVRLHRTSGTTGARCSSPIRARTRR